MSDFIEDTHPEQERVKTPTWQERVSSFFAHLTKNSLSFLSQLFDFHTSILTMLIPRIG